MKEKKKCLMFKLMSDQKRYVLIVAEVFSRFNFRNTNW